MLPARSINGICNRCFDDIFFYGVGAGIVRKVRSCPPPEDHNCFTGVYQFGHYGFKCGVVSPRARPVRMLPASARRTSAASLQFIELCADEIRGKCFAVGCAGAAGFMYT